MSKVWYCHQMNKPGIVCNLKRHGGVCTLRCGVFGKCQWQEDYPPIPPLPPIESFSSKAEDEETVSKDYLRGFRDGVLSVQGERK